MAAWDLHETGVLPLFRESNRRKGSYEHKDQISFYENIREHDECYMDDSDTEGNYTEMSGSKQFRKCYRFREKTGKALCLLLGNEIKPKATTNNAFNEMQRLCIALRFYATGSHQMAVGDVKGHLRPQCQELFNKLLMHWLIMQMI